MTRACCGCLFVAAAFFLGSTPMLSAAEPAEYDIVIYGGTSGGVTAGVQAAKLGRSVVIIEPGQHLGGLTTGGLGATDIGNKAAIGGLSREFYRKIKQYYEQDSAWKQQRRDQYRSNRQRAGEDTMWTFEPHVAEKLMDEWVEEAGVKVVRGERLDLTKGRGVVMDGQRIVAIRLESGKEFRGKMFIDATYEGDLLALAGVSYTVGREGNDQYQETLNGVQTRQATKHQFVPGVDPYVEPGNPKSGLLPGVHAGPPGEEGSADKRVQAYNFRMCLTDDPENRIPFAKPEGYDPLRYELLLRNFEAGERRIPWSPTPMPNRKTDTNNNHGFSTDNIGMNYDWPEADYATREKIFQEHLHYQRGLMWTLANDPRVPEPIRREVSRWGVCRDEFADYEGWPHQLYVREARRMVSDYVMTQHHCQGRTLAEQPVGMAAYTMDSHNVQRYVDAKGQVRNEGDVQVGGFPPYPIDYRSIVPAEKECTNLLVPVCLSASHIAYGSIRMEPVFMVLGQSAATAASQALDENVPVQRINYPKLQQKLLDDNQVLEWTGPRPAAALDPKKLPGVVVDDTQAQVEGEWLRSTSIGPFLGNSYLHDNDGGKGEKSVAFRLKAPATGRFDIRLGYTANPNRAPNVPVTVQTPAGSRTVTVDQRKKPPIEGVFLSLGTETLKAGDEITVTIHTSETKGHVIADGVQLLPVND